MKSEDIPISKIGTAWLWIHHEYADLEKLITGCHKLYNDVISDIRIHDRANREMMDKMLAFTRSADPNYAAPTAWPLYVQAQLSDDHRLKFGESFCWYANYGVHQWPRGTRLPKHLNDTDAKDWTTLGSKIENFELACVEALDFEGMLGSRDGWQAAPKPAQPAVISKPEVVPEAKDEGRWYTPKQLRHLLDPGDPSKTKSLQNARNTKNDPLIEGTDYRKIVIGNNTRPDYEYRLDAPAVRHVLRNWKLKVDAELSKNQSTTKY